MLDLGRSIATASEAALTIAAVAPLLIIATASAVTRVTAPVAKLRTKLGEANRPDDKLVGALVPLKQEDINSLAG